MNERILRFLEAENISQSQFADSIGVARASISHIVSGRNKPGFDFIERTAMRYPSLNIEWLITGKGRMYKATDGGILDSQRDDELFPELESAPSPIENQPVREEKHGVSGTRRKISHITVFYTDGTFEEFK